VHVLAWLGAIFNGSVWLSTRTQAPVAATSKLFSQEKGLTTKENGHHLYQLTASHPAIVMLLNMLQYPKAATALGVAYLTSRLAYFEAYRTSKYSKKRLLGFKGCCTTLSIFAGLCLSIGGAAVFACMRNK
jgi:hypothetical protein